MNVVWSDEAAYALVALETKLAERYPAEKAARSSTSSFGVSIGCKTIRSSGALFQNTGTGSSGSWSTNGIACSIAWVLRRLRS